VKPLLPWRNNKYYIFCVCVCCISYPACKAHAPYYNVMWPVRPYNIYPRYLVNGTIFWKKRFWFCLQLLSETSVMLRRIQQHNIIRVLAFSCKLRFILVIFLRTLNFLGKFSKKWYKIWWISVQWEPSCSMRKDRHVHDEANSRFSHFLLGS